MCVPENASHVAAGPCKYISGLTPESGEFLKHYQELYDDDPFSEDTIEAGTNLNDHIKETRKHKLEETITGIDLTHNSKKGWQTLSNINGDDRKPNSSPNITPDAIAHQLLLKGKPGQNCKIRNKKAVLKTDSHETILTPFTIRDLGDAIYLLKNGKAQGLDNIPHELIKCFGQTTWLWLLDMLNDCLKRMAESKSSRTVEARKRCRKPKELQADPLFAVPAYREDDPHSPSVQDRAQAKTRSRQLSDRGNRAAHKC